LFRDIPQTIYGLNKRINYIYDVLARINRPLRVLDVGCGTGEFVSIPLAEMGFDVVGIDTHLPSLAHGRESATRRNIQGISFRCATAAELEDKFDAIILSEVLEHVKSPNRLLKTLNDLLRSDGILIVTVPNGYGPFEIDQFLWKRDFLYLSSLLQVLQRHIERPRDDGGLDLSPATRNDDSPHINFFSWRAIHKVLRQAGFDVVHYRGRTLIAGSYATIFFKALSLFGCECKSILDLNARMADYSPPQVVSDWMFVCRKQCW